MLHWKLGVIILYGRCGVCVCVCVCVCVQDILRFKCQIFNWKYATVEFGRIKFDNIEFYYNEIHLKK